MAAVWRDIAADLRAAIESGRYAPGDRLPKEEDLAQQYGVVRNTVRKALAELTAAGLLTARPRLGTFVRSTPVRLAVARYAESADPDRPRADLGPWEAACAAQGRTGQAEVVAVNHVPAPADVARRLGVTPGQAVVQRVRRMRADDQVEQLQEAWMPLALVEGTPLADASKVIGGVYAAMRQIGIVPTRAIEEVAPRLPTTHEAEELGLAPGQPVIEQWRVTYDPSDQPIEVTRAVSARCVFAYDVPLSHGRR